MVPGAEEGSMSELRQRRTVVHRAASGAVAKLVDALMTEIGEGPCLDAAFGDRVIRVDDMTADGRWPTFTARAAEAGVRSMLSFPLYVQDNDLGALNLYAATPNAFTDEAEHLGLIFATHAAITIAGAQRLGQLQGALASREVIGQAVGILIERHGIDTARAFATLVRYSQDTNRKLRDVAADIVRSALARNERGSKG
ncbi:GAF and ANTAR domain-containing protein [Tenggerimyces flavus]|uniref:GAF and ANTAR domain-containing protein n=2 Tax=Tenggerimyces flavus TaxID=1708749 RepID=A0ABV7YJN4_9ACTN